MSASDEREESGEEDKKALAAQERRRLSSRKTSPRLYRKHAKGKGADWEMKRKEEGRGEKKKNGIAFG